ncbi:PREDICTED: snRNA-activating protein complex subunit 2 isoform X2 [Chinchilla lanigera]|uniref:snRNA-activating protein complex subunit 2 isoform X2 n=1 Tax=Chinchilla lanigera TaxID=34839 RepID=UPI00038EA9B3|nr:PREDICTED: snRNA-activating protein complex subunit 2 isoform X2 [Chinchilla lanigera]
MSVSSVGGAMPAVIGEPEGWGRRGRRAGVGGGASWAREALEAVRDFLQHLKGRVAREAIQRAHPGGPRGPRRPQAQVLAPIEVRRAGRPGEGCARALGAGPGCPCPSGFPQVWTDLGEKLTGPLEEPLTAAFSQVLTIAAAEPLSLLHSKPPKPTAARAKTPRLGAATGQQGRTPDVCGLAVGPAPRASGAASVTLGPAPVASGSAPSASKPAPEVPGPTPETLGCVPEAPAESLAVPSPEGDLTVDFEKIYKYLSFSSRSGQGPELSAAESAVVLDLLLSLPEELPHLPCTALAEHMTKTYDRLMAPERSPCGGSAGPGAEEGPGSRVPEEPSQGPHGAPEHSTPSELRSAWQAAGVCPLNPFLVPLELLGRAVTPAR